MLEIKSLLKVNLLYVFDSAFFELLIMHSTQNLC